MPCQLTITPDKRAILAGPHPSTGKPVEIPVPTLASGTRLVVKGDVGEHKDVLEVTVLEGRALKIKAVGLPEARQPLDATLTMTLRGDLFQNARRLGVVVPRATDSALPA